ncbi:MAG: sulfite exporter TauE/SafE family protein [Patescibacteria group bacterium]|jgi:sulfite exporter TauE/SafE/copper chaperone CopZ
MSQNKYLKVPIKGMHCRSCEILIEEKLREVNHVKSANLNYKTSEAIIHYREIAPDMNDIKKAIAEAGYEIGESEKLPFLSRNRNDYANLGNAFLIIAILYFLFKNLGLFNLNVTSDLTSPGFGLIVLIGLVAGFSTCMALVGGLVLGLSTKFAENHPNATVKEKFKPHIFFVVGRILSYAFLGGLLGVIGKIFQVSPFVNGLLTLSVGIVMLVMGLQLIDIFPRLSKFKLSLPKGVSRVLGITKKREEYSHRNAMILGGLTFFLPCGFTQAMQLYAISTGSFGAGALVMGLFALGTAPGLLSIGGLTSIIQGSFKELFFKVAGLAVIFFAIFNLNNGYSLTSLSAVGFRVNSFSAASNQTQNNINDPNVVLENGVQVVHMTENSNGYSPNRFSVKKGVPVKWIVEAKAPYSCASVLLIPKLKIQKFLAAGENIIEFTPTESGQLPFSCSMGMYTGVFNVYDGDSASVDSNITVGVNTALAAANT